MSAESFLANYSVPEDLNSELLNDPHFRESIYKSMHPKPVARFFSLARKMLDHEVTYRQDENHDGEYFENIYWVGAPNRPTWIQEADLISSSLLAAGSWKLSISYGFKGTPNVTQSRVTSKNVVMPEILIISMNGWKIASNISAKRKLFESIYS